MLRLQKSAKMLLKKSLIIGSLLLVGCGGMPIKPKVIICVIDYPAGQGICNETSGQAITSVDQLSYQSLVNSIKTLGERVPLETMDKSVCFSPSEWEKVKNYVDALERYARQKK